MSSTGELSLRTEFLSRIILVSMEEFVEESSTGVAICGSSLIVVSPSELMSSSGQRVEAHLHVMNGFIIAGDLQLCVNSGILV